MDLANFIIGVKNKKDSMLVVDWVGHDSNRFDELMRLVFNGNDKQRQKAAWIITHVTDRYPDLSRPYLDNMLNVIEIEGEHQGVYRSLIRVFTKCHLPEELHERIIDIMFAVAASDHRSVAERAFAMQVCSIMVRRYNDLANELELIVQGIPEADKTPAIRSTIRGALRAIAYARS